MSNLDDKLINALCSYESGANQRVMPERGLLENAMSNIKRAFADDREKEPSLTAEDLGLMTGQEWYDRFREEYKREHNKYSQDVDTDEYWIAAKRAAGLE